VDAACTAPSSPFKSLPFHDRQRRFAGIILTLALNKVMAAWATESSRDSLMLLASAFVLATVAALACTFPARRAASVDPMKAIRYE